MDNKNNSSFQEMDMFTQVFYVIFIVAALIIGLVTMLPALLIAITIAAITIVFAVPLQGVYISLAGLVMGVIAFFKSFNVVINFFSSSFELVFKAIKALIAKKPVGAMLFEYYQSSFENSFLINLILGVIIAGSLVELWFMKRNKAFKDMAKPIDIEKTIEDTRKAENKLKKLENVKHPEGKTVLGVDVMGKQITINDDAKHIAIAGTTGAGKTVTISNFIESAFQKNYGLVAIDGKGDIGKGSMLHYMQELAKKQNRKLYVINLTKPKCSDTYNPFKGAEMTEAKDMLIGMSEFSEQHYKVNTERYLQRLIKILNLSSVKLSLENIIKFTPDNFRLLNEQLLKEDLISQEEAYRTEEIIKECGSIAASAMARFATTAESEAGEIFAEDGVDIYQALRENAAILFILDSLGKPEMSKQIGRLVILDAKKAVSKLFGEDTSRKFFIFDEFNVYASDIVIDLINKSRSAGVTVIPAFQSLSDLTKAAGEAFRDQVIENCNNYIIMRQNAANNALEWERTIGEKDILQVSFNYRQDDNIFNNSSQKPTNSGTITRTRDSIYRADEIKRLTTGECIYVSRDTQEINKLKVKRINLETEKPELEEKERKAIISTDILSSIKSEKINNNKAQKPRKKEPAKQEAAATEEEKEPIKENKKEGESVNLDELNDFLT